MSLSRRRAGLKRTMGLNGLKHGGACALEGKVIAIVQFELACV